MVLVVAVEEKVADAQVSAVTVALVVPVSELSFLQEKLMAVMKSVPKKNDAVFFAFVIM